MNLTQAWTRASAALPLGWRIEGLFLVGDGWQAVAAHSDGRQLGNAAGTGSDPIQALLDLAEELRPIRGDVTGAANEASPE